MNKRFLLITTVLGLMWSACSSNNSEVGTRDTLTTDSLTLDRTAADSLDIKAAPIDSPAVGSDNIRMDSMNNNPKQ